MIPNVVSIKPERLHIFDDRGRLLISKVTTERELNNFLRASRLLPDKPPIQSPLGLLKISTPEFVGWDAVGKQIKMSFEIGLNLELILRDADRSDRGAWVNFVSQLFAWFKLTGFLWDDCSPRNIILDG